MSFPEKLKVEIRTQCHHKCCLCQSIGVEIHHIIPQEKGGENTLDNAAPLCAHCHETYGANPTKRKMIREARDNWLSICKTRYASDSSRLQEIHERVSRLESALEISADKSAPERGTYEHLLKDEHIERTSESGMALGSIISRIIEFPKLLPIKQQSLSVTHALLFETEGSPEDEKDLEYNIIRDQFAAAFGRLATMGLAAYITHQTNLDWEVGVIEPEGNKALSCNFAAMVMLLNHEDIPGVELPLIIDFTEDGNLRAKAARGEGEGVPPSREATA